MNEQRLTEVITERNAEIRDLEGEADLLRGEVGSMNLYVQKLKDENAALTAEVERLRGELHTLHRRKCAYCNPAEMRRILGDPCGVTIMNNDPEKAMEFLAGKLSKPKDRPDA